MANTQIKITQLPNIGNNLGANTLLPVVDTTGTAITEKVTVGNVANYILNEAGNLLPVASVAEISYSVANAAQPNITSVGTLNINTLHISGGVNGYFLQTNGDGNLSWAAADGSGNGSPGGANSQIQFNNSGLFAGSTSLTWDAGNSQLNTVNIGASGATIYGNLATVNATVTTNLTAANANFTSTISNTISATGNITANFFLGNGSALTGITATANGAGPNNSIQYNAGGIFAGDADLTWNPNTNTLTTTDISANNISLSANVSANKLSVTGNAIANIFVGNFLYGDGSNISNVTSNTANIANLANFVVVEPVNNNFSYHVVLTTGPNDFSLHNDADDSFQYNPIDGILTVTRVDTQFLEAGNVISNLTPFIDVSYDIGSNTHRWNDLYLSNSTIYLGNATISANGNSIVVDSISVTNGNIGTIGNISAINLDGSNSNVLYGNGVFAPATGGGGLPIANGNSNIDIPVANGNVTVTSNGTHIWKFRDDGWFELPGDIYSNSNINFNTSGSFNPSVDGDILLYAGLNSIIVSNNIGSSHSWVFANTGLLELPGGNVKIGSQYGSEAILASNASFGVATQGSNVTTFMNWSDDVSNTSVMAAIYVNAPNANPGDIHFRTGDVGTPNIWQFNSDGNLVLAGGNSVIFSTANSSLDPLISSVSTMTLTPDANYNSQVLVLDPTAPGHIHLRAYAFSNIDDPAANIFLGGENTSFEVTQGANNDARIHSGSNTWTFGNDGNLVTPGLTGTYIKSAPGGYMGLAAMNDGGDQPAQLVSFDSNLGLGTTAISAYANEALIQTNIAGGNMQTWVFSNTGNLTLPGNTFAVNYANGTQVPLGGGGNANTGNVTFDDQVVIGTGDEYGGGGLYLAPGTNSTGNLQYLRVRGGDYPTHIHLDTGNNNYFDQYFGADFRYVKLEANGNIVINADDDNGNSATWTFDTTGNFHVANGNSVIQSVPNNAGDGSGLSTLNLIPDNSTGDDRYLIVDPTGPNHLHLRAGGAQDASTTALFLGGEQNYVQVLDNSGLRLQNQLIDVIEHVYSDPADFINATWFTDSGNFYIQYTSLNAQLTNDAYQDINSIFVVYPSSSAYLTYGGSTQSLGGGVYKVKVDQGPPSEPTALTQINYYINVLKTNFIDLDSDGFNVYSEDDAAITGTGYVQIVNNSNVNPVSIIANNSGSAKTWNFEITGNLTLPGNTFAVNYANGSQASAPLVDILNTNGLSTVFYPTFVENRTDGQIVRADVDLSYRSDTNTLTVGNITGNTNGYTLGYLNIPQVSASNTTLGLTDAGKHYYSTTAGNLTLTIPNNATTSFATGTAISIVVQAAGNVLVNAAAGVTLYMAGSSTAGNRVVGTYGMATLMKVASDTWFINGTGVY